VNYDEINQDGEEKFHLAKLAQIYLIHIKNVYSIRKVEKSVLLAVKKIREKLKGTLNVSASYLTKNAVGR
jgi:hypothetical protein